MTPDGEVVPISISSSLLLGTAEMQEFDSEE